MIAPAVQSKQASSTTWQRDFESMMPAIHRRARIAFRHLQGDARDEAVQEAVCHACMSYARLVEQGRAHAVSPSTLAHYAVARVREGRHVGSPINVRDVCSRYCQQKTCVKVRPLDRWDDGSAEWKEMLVEDKTATPADLAASRIDVPAFLASLGKRNRRIAERLATGESTAAVARLFGLTPGRVSQLRQQMSEEWRRFHGDPAPAPS